MNDIEMLNQRVVFLENTLASLVRSDRYTVSKLMQLLDGQNIQLGKTTGTKIGTEGGATGQKLGFFGTTPVVQRPTYTITNLTTDRAYDANSTTTDELADVLGTLIADLKNLGLIIT